MSAENVDLVRALMPTADRNLVAWFNDEEAMKALANATSDLIDSSSEIWMTRIDGEGRTDFGLEGLIRVWLEWLEPWESYRAEIRELIDAGDRVLVITDDYGRAKGSSAEVRLRGSAVWTVRDRKVASIEFSADRDQAFKDVGLDPGA